MTDLEERAIRSLSKCYCQAFSFDARLIKCWAKWPSSRQLSERGARRLWQLIIRYRRQIQDTELIQYAEQQRSN